MAKPTIKERVPFAVYRSLTPAQLKAHDGDAIAALQALYDARGLGWQLEPKGYSIVLQPNGNVFVTAFAMAREEDR